MPVQWDDEIAEVSLSKPVSDGIRWDDAVVWDDEKGEHGMAGELAAGLGRGALRVIATPASLADVAGEAVGWKGLERVGEAGAEKVEKFIEESPRLRKSPSITGDIRDNPQLWTDPRWYLSLIGEGAPTIASMIIPGMVGAKVAQVAGLGAKGIMAARMGGALTAGMGLEAGGAAEDVRQYEKRTGVQVPISKKLKTVAGTGVVAGSLEAVPIFNLFGKTVAKRLIGRIITSMAFEGGTEGAQEIVANAFAKAGYDADRDMVGGVIESIVGGVLLGGGMGAMQQTFQERIEKTDSNEVADVLEQAEKETTEARSGLNQKAMLSNIKADLESGEITADDVVALTKLPEAQGSVDDLNALIIDTKAKEELVKPIKTPEKKAVKPTPTESTAEVAREPVGVEKSIIPDFKTTQEAYAFGEKATPEQVKELQRLGKVQDAKFKELKEAGDLDEAMNVAVKGQFYNEALQKIEGTEQYKKFQPKKKVVDEKIAKAKVYVHETDKVFDKFDMTKVGMGQGEAWLGRGIYLQEKGTFKIEQYGNKKVEVTVKPKAKIFEVKETPDSKYRDSFVEYAVRKGIDGGLAEKRIKEGLQLKNLLPRDIFRVNPAIVEQLKKDGFDGLLQDGELVVYNADMLEVVAEKVETITGYSGTYKGKPTGKYLYLTENKEYAKKFGEDIRQFTAQIKNTFDITDLKEKSISFEKLQKEFKDRGVEITESMREQYDDVYKPAWQWLKKYPDMMEAVKSIGYDSIRQFETFIGKGKLNETVAILDKTLVEARPPKPPKAKPAEAVTKEIKGEVIPKPTMRPDIVTIYDEIMAEMPKHIKKDISVESIRTVVFPSEDSGEGGRTKITGKLREPEKYHILLEKGEKDLKGTLKHELLHTYVLKHPELLKKKEGMFSHEKAVDLLEKELAIPKAKPKVEKEAKPPKVPKPETKTQISKAYLKISKGKSNVRVRLSDLRSELKDISRDELDATLKKMQLNNKLVLMSLDSFEIRKSDKDASIDVGGDANHVVYMKVEVKPKIEKEKVEVTPEKKEAWEMTKKEILESIRTIGKKDVVASNLISMGKGILTEGMTISDIPASEIPGWEKVLESHRKDIEKAIKENKTIPPEVLKDYPDLKIEEKVKVEPTEQLGKVWIKNVQKPIISAREITKGKNKGKYVVVLTRGRDAEGNIKAGLKRVVAKDDIVAMPVEKLEKPTGVSEKQKIEYIASQEKHAKVYVPITRKEADALFDKGSADLIARFNVRGPETTGEEGYYMRLPVQEKFTSYDKKEHLKHSEEVISLYEKYKKRYGGTESGVSITSGETKQRDGRLPAEVRGEKAFATKAIKPQDTITRADLKSIFAKMKNITTGQDKDGNFFFRPFGKPVVTIHEVNEIEGYIDTSKGQIPVGSFLGNTIELKTGGEGYTADISIAWHEFEHWMEANNILSGNDIKALNTVLEKQGISPNAETRADYVGESLHEWQGQKNLRIKRVLKKIADFVNAIYEVVSRTRTARGVLAGIETGKLLGKEIIGKKAETLIPAFQQTAPYWYSQVVKAVEQKFPAKMNARSITNWIKKQGGKPVELEWLGLDEWLEGKKVVTKEELSEFLRANQVEVREVEKKSSIDINWEGEKLIVGEDTYEVGEVEDYLKKEFNLNEDDNWGIAKNSYDISYESDSYFNTQQEAKDYVESLIEDRDIGETKFSNWQLPGEKENYKEVFLTLPNAKGYSWQDGHSEYSDIKNPIVRIRLNERIDTKGDKVLFLEEVQKPSHEEQEKMPPTIREEANHIALKHMLRYASENGFDKMAWTTGQQQADRYDLSKQLERVDVTYLSTAGYRIAGYDYNSEKVINKSGLTKEQLPDYIGKELADKALGKIGGEDKGAAVFKGLDLKTGGEWATQLYDHMIPQYLKKFGRRWKAKIENIEINKNVQQAINITPLMKQSAMREGMPLFATKPTKDYSAMLKKYQEAHTTPLVDKIVEKTKIKHFYNLEKVSSQPAWIKEKFGRIEKTLVEKIGDNVGAFRKNWQTRLLDRLHPIKALGETAYMLHRLETGAQATMAMFMRHGKLRWQGKALTIDTQKQGFMSWLNGLGDDAQKLFYWMAAKRAEVLETEGREKWLDADTRKKIFDWVGDKPKSEKSWKILNNQFQEFNKSVLNLAQQAGLIDPIKRATWEQEFYVPFYRIFEDAVAREEFLKGPFMGKKHISAQIKRLLGAEMKIGDPLENVIRNWSHLIHESVRNMARSEAYNYAEKNKIKSGMTDESGKLMPLIETVKASDLNIYRSDKEKRMVYVTKKGDDNILSFQKNGRRIYFKVNDIEIFNALSDVNHRQFNGFLIKAFGQAKRWLTYGATFGPAFKVANMLRDSLHTAIISKSFIPFIDSGKGIVKALKEDADYVKFMASGAGFGSSYIRAENPQALAEYINRIVKKEGKGAAQRVLDTPKKMLDFWEKLGAASENAARVQLYTKRIAEGETHLKAAFEGRDLMDFTMRGDSQIVQFLIRTVPFMNARAQGLYKLGRAAKQDPKSFMIKGSMLTIATLALWAINRDEDEWKELEDWDKRTYYHFWIGDKHYRTPKPFETGAIFSTIFEGMAEVMSGDEEFGYFVDVMKDTFLDTFAMNPIPQAVRPLIEQWSNKSFFTGRPIEGQSLQRLRPAERKTAWTSETMQLAGKLGIFPKRAEEIIRGYFSTFGMFLLGISDIFAYHLADFPVNPTKEINDYPLLGRFIKERVPARHTKYQTKFYEMFREVDQLVATINNQKRLGNYKEAAILARKERKKIAKRKKLFAVRSQLTKINAELRKTMSSRLLTAEQKRAKIDRLIERKNKITRNIYEAYVEN